MPLCFMSAQVQVVFLITFICSLINDALEHLLLAILARRKMRSVFIVLVTLSSASVVTSCIWTTPPPCRSRCTPPRPPPPTLAWETTISSAQAGNQVVWAVSCNGPCRNLRAELTTSSGDADLYANEDDHPSLGGYQCPTCSMCEAVTADLDDTCSNMASSGNSFYLMVAAYSSYTNMRLKLFGNNVNSVTAAPTTTPGPTTTPSGGGGNATGCLCGKNVVTRKGAGWSSKVVGGVDAAKGEVGWQVGLSSSSSTSFASIFCGGTLLNERWVLTAAHCTDGTSNPASIRVWIGLIKRNNPSDSDAIVIQVDWKGEHPSYGSGSSINYDFALLRLSQAVDFTNPALSHVFPACWPSSEPTTAGERAVISGWGTTSSGGSQPNELQKANVEIITRATCNGASSYSGSVTSQMICAGFMAGGIDTCQGDSGGPLVTLNGNNWEVTGITSWGHGCAGANKPGVYANAFAARQWIASTTGSTECPRA